MSEPVKKTIDKKQVAIFESDASDAPTLYANMVMDSGEAVLRECKTLNCRPFHLVTITRLRWDEELSPWAHEPVVSKNDRFTGGANEYARRMTERIIPYAESVLGRSRGRILAGYSMAGLFALYAPYVTGAFDAVVCASGSVWYPGFVSFVETHEFAKTPAAIYLSLGASESRAKNTYLRETDSRMKTLSKIYAQKSIRCVYELNPGNHYTDAPLRLAKGIAWVLDEKFSLQK